MHLFYDGCLVCFRAVVEESLDHSTAILVLGQFTDSALAAVHDEPNVLPWYSRNGLLDHMISILVFDDTEHIGLKFLK